jgi:glycosyltransferase involved in cell wall biosynthesis
LGNELKKEDLEIVISTMNRTNLDFLIPMFPFGHFSNFSVLIVNQTQEDNLLTSYFPSINVINSFDKGLSKSRNLGLKNAKGKIILIADDDVVYKQNFDQKIIEAYNQFPNAAIISFCIEKSNGELFKKYHLNAKNNLSVLELFTVLSIEISVNAQNIEKLELVFDENFGLGSYFEMGEEAIFLTDIKRRNYLLSFFPAIIAIHSEISSNEKFDIAKKYYIQGAFLTRVLKKQYKLHLIMKLFFDLKQQKIKINQIATALKNAKLGRKDFYKLVNQVNA